VLWIYMGYQSWGLRSHSTRPLDKMASLSLLGAERAEKTCERERRGERGLRPTVNRSNRSKTTGTV